MRQYNFYTYILTTSTKKVLYTGVTNDLERRLYEHYFGTDTKDNFTTKYKCYYLVWFERHQYVITDSQAVYLSRVEDSSLCSE
jgi:putative endonuclease